MIGGWGGLDIGKARKANAILKPELVLRHLYDFGTTSETDIKVVGFREGKATTKHPIALLARNRMPEFVCQECGQPAQWLCIECVYEEDNSGYLCDEHMEEHPLENYGEPMIRPGSSLTPISSTRTLVATATDRMAGRIRSLKTGTALFNQKRLSSTSAIWRWVRGIRSKA
jgi:hypothetical protein